MPDVQNYIQLNLNTFGDKYKYLQHYIHIMRAERLKMKILQSTNTTEN